MLMSSLCSMKVLVITTCTGRKKHKPPNQLNYEDFASLKCLRRRTAELKDFKVPAAEMYTGQQHQHLMAGLEEVRKVYGSKGLCSNKCVMLSVVRDYRSLKRFDSVHKGFLTSHSLTDKHNFGCCRTVRKDESSNTCYQR
jgi:hypothetical protein